MEFIHFSLAFVVLWANKFNLSFISVKFAETLQGLGVEAQS